MKCVALELRSGWFNGENRNSQLDVGISPSGTYSKVRNNHAVHDERIWSGDPEVVECVILPHHQVSVPGESLAVDIFFTSPLVVFTVVGNIPQTVVKPHQLIVQICLMMEVLMHYGC